MKQTSCLQTRSFVKDSFSPTNLHQCLLAVSKSTMMRTGIRLIHRLSSHRGTVPPNRSNRAMRWQVSKQNSKLRVANWQNMKDCPTKPNNLSNPLHQVEVQ